MRNIDRRSLFSVLVVLFMVCLLPVKGFAFSINKGSVKVGLSKGETYNGSVEIRNPSENSIEVTAYINDFVYLPPFRGDKEFYPPSSTKFSLTDWVSISPQKLTVPPYSDRYVNFTVTPAQDFEEVKCGVIFFESSLGITQEEGKVVNVLGRIGTLVCVNPEPGNKRIDFYDIKGGNYKISGGFKNSGNTFLHPEGTYFIMDNEGMVKDRGTVKEVYFLPRDNTSLDIEISKTISKGSYIMVVTFNLGEGDIAVKEIDFSLSPSGDIEILEVRD